MLLRMKFKNQEASTLATLILHFTDPVKAFICMINEENAAEIPVEGNVIKVSLKANELVSLRIM